MKISVIGTGYVGLVAAAAFADHGNDVVCADIDKAKIEGLECGIIPIYEPGLDTLVERNTEAGRLSFTTDNAEAAARADVLILAVGTPTGSGDGAPDLSALLDAVKSCAPKLSGFTVVANKSTVPVGTAERIERCLREHGAADVAVTSNPEFLKEGVAVQDFMQPDRVIVGTKDERARTIMRELYAPFMRSKERILFMDPRSAELTKYTANAYLATRVSFINDVANLCDAVGANVDQVRQGMGTDSRIGHKFLYPGIGYGGSCFPKDTRALIRSAREHGMPMSIVAAAERINEIQKLVLLRKLRDRFDGQLEDKVIAIWGLAFKPETDDVREAPALSIARGLLSAGARLSVYDPEAGSNFCRELGFDPEALAGGPRDVLALAHTPYAAAEGADALVLATEWRQFRSPDFKRLHQTMRQPVLFDGRNLWNRELVEGLGFSYDAIGR